MASLNVPAVQWTAFVRMAAGV
ncbi:hypothetical protein [Streptomyces sp. YIM B13518]